ncbi:MAG TPA: aldehyde ferredoxin oxidoreductase N-terminal domain-containing protein, partial [Kouleothrix sp.]|nr:aldehyde ferredoxin oxidoreductase N-terminal domain-containing protein [Kouleothrix sp.]
MPLCVLRVLLDTRQTVSEELPPEIERNYLGGRGAATWLLTHRVAPATGPLSPANPLIFSAGALAGMGIAATGGFVASTRSPITRLMSHSWAQGNWGGALRRAGYDVLMLEGQCAEWSYIQIDDAQVRVQPAAELLGLDTRATARALQQKLGDGYRVLCIGPAGEAGVAYSTIVAEGTYPAEPAGTGAIMARKRVKAIAVRGSRPRAP